MFIPWFINYPYQNDEIMNLDWLLKNAQINGEKIDNFINLNTIKYADPILWDITSQYEANTVVIDPQTGDAYISTKPVPYGAHLNNTDYWTIIYNYPNAINTLEEQIAVANEKLSPTATAARSVDDLVWLNGLLYVVTAPMIAGDSYVEGSNIAKITIEEILAKLQIDIGNEASARIAADTALGQRITDEATARAIADTDLGGRITDEAEARANADTALGGRITDEATARANADTALGGRITDEATARAEADTALGGRITDEATARANADTALANKLKWIALNKILIIGDSISDENRSNCWVKSLRTLLPFAEITNDSLNGRWLNQVPSVITNYNLNDYDVVIIFAGINDFINNAPIGNWGTGNAFTDSLRKICNMLQLTTAKCYMITSLCTTRTSNYLLNMWRSIMTEACRYWGVNWINGAGFPKISGNTDLTFMSDGLHPDDSYSPIMALHIVEKILSGGDSADLDNIPYSMDMPSSVAPTGVTLTRKKMCFANGKLSFILEGTFTFSNTFYTPVFTPPIADIFNFLSDANYPRYEAVVTQNNEVIPATAWYYNGDIIVQHGSGKSGTADLILRVEVMPKVIYI